MPTNRHLIITESEQLIIVNALAFYASFFSYTLNEDDREQFQLAFREEGGTEAVNRLTNKVATIR